MVKVENLSADALPLFFMKHLEQDIEDLASTIQRSKDEATIVLHLVLQQMLSQDPPKSEYWDIQLHTIVHV